MNEQTPPDGFDIPAYLAGKTDAELVQATVEAQNDLMSATDDEWQGACFAAVFVYAGELNRRGLKIPSADAQTLHVDQWQLSNGRLVTFHPDVTVSPFEPDSCWASIGNPAEYPGDQQCGQ